MTLGVSTAECFLVSLALSPVHATYSTLVDLAIRRTQYVVPNRLFGAIQSCEQMTHSRSRITLQKWQKRKMRCTAECGRVTDLWQEHELNKFSIIPIYHRQFVVHRILENFLFAQIALAVNFIHDMSAYVSSAYVIRRFRMLRLLHIMTSTCAIH